MSLDALFPDGMSWWRLLLALVIGVAGWILSHYSRKGLLALMRRTPGITDAVANVAARFIGYAILVLGLGIALAVLGANVQPLLAIVVIIAVVAVLVLRGVADNFAAGVLLQTRQSVKVGDELVFEALDGEMTGTVSELNARSVVLLTVDGRTVHLPNAKLLSDPLINHSTHGARRSEVQVRVQSAPDRVRDVLTVLQDATAGTEGVHQRESVHAVIVTVADERMTARVQFWHHPLHAVPVTAAVVLAITDALLSSGWKGTVTSAAGSPPLVPPDDI